MSSDLLKLFLQSRKRTICTNDSIQQGGNIKLDK